MKMKTKVPMWDCYWFFQLGSWQAFFCRGWLPVSREMENSLSLVSLRRDVCPHVSRTMSQMAKPPKWAENLANETPIIKLGFQAAPISEGTKSRSRFLWKKQSSFTSQSIEAPTIFWKLISHSFQKRCSHVFRAWYAACPSLVGQRLAHYFML